MRRIKWLVTSFMVVGSIFLLTSVAYGQTQGKLTGYNVRVREYPSLESDSNILFQVSRGQSVEILDIVGDFYLVNVKDTQNVYIFREFITVTETPGILNQDGIPILASPETYYDIIAIYDYGASFFVTGRYGAWYEIRYNGERGFVERNALNVWFNESLSTVRPPRSNDGHSNSGILVDGLIAYAKSYLGTPYRFGSTDPRVGFDCSGFVTVVMRQFGIYLQRSSASMASTNGIFVERNALEAGDLVFFATGGGGRVSHVGIYIGGDRFIHSATRGGVIISSMSETYWRTRYVRANRVI